MTQQPMNQKRIVHQQGSLPDQGLLPPRHMDWKRFRILFMAMFTAMLGQGLVVPLLPVYAHQLGASNVEIGWIFSALPLAQILWMPYFGRQSDKRGKKHLIVAGLGLYCLISVGLALFKAIPALIVIRFFQGMAACMILPIAVAYVGELTPHHREGTTGGVLNMAPLAGLAVGPLVGGLLNDALGIESTFYTMGVVCLVGLGWVATHLPPAHQEPAYSHVPAPGGVTALIRDRFMLGLYFQRLGFNICMAAIWAYTPLLAALSFGASSRVIGLMITASVLCGMLCSPLMGYLADRFNRHLLILLGNLLAVATMFLIPAATGALELGILCALIGVGLGLTFPTVNSMAIVHCRPLGLMGTAIALLGTSASIGMFIGPVMVGALMDRYDTSVAFHTAGMAMVAATLVTLALTYRSKRCNDNTVQDPSEQPSQEQP